ncbi:hypothetical protein MWU52_07915 [Jannaschia sp. S6380]|uniref:hypothetical protein n=1 Tax=Jannaschia sp. S6380 TaxID=2926408 RepID=UPI001FF4E219|nr:hypothetical protein [Jannaschia sp. S6380]MCK0167469.1 hypothetical protein [Jannaschia sp. S6380]
MTDPNRPEVTPARPGPRDGARLADAARLLPFLGAALLLVPDLVLSGGPAAEGATSGWLNYLFAVWAILIGLAFWIARIRLRDPDDPREDPP